MNKLKKYLLSMMIIIMVSLINFSNITSAHSLTEWANMYTQENAGGNFQFSIGDKYHINGNTVNYYWANSTVSSYFESSLKDAVSAWDGMINAVETAESNAHMKISYDDDLTAEGKAAYVLVRLGSGHYSAGGVKTEMVIGNIIDYTTNNKKMVLAHELGHVWGINDLYTVGKNNLESIYADAYNFNAATRHDKNAMFICLNMPWFVNWDGVWYQKSPGVWANNEWLTIYGQEYYFHNGVRTTAYKVHYNANGGSGVSSYQTKLQGTNITLNNQPSTAKFYKITYNVNGGSLSTTSKNVYCTFKNWNTNSEGTGTSYGAAATYSADSATTLYAQWNNSKVGTLPTPTRSGYIFKGWYTLPSGGVEVTASTIATKNMTIYAQWIPIVSLNTTYTSNINQAGKEVYYAFKPTTSGVYKIYSEGSLDSYVNLYTNTYYQLAYNDDGGTDRNFSLTYWLREGETYYIKTKLYSSSLTGTFNVKIQSSSGTTYTITYNGNASEVTGVPASEKKISGISITLPEKCPTRMNYVFLGWSTTSTSKIPTYYKVNGKFNTTFSTNAKTVLYAIWGLKGDINMSGSVTLDDAQLALDYYQHVKSPTEHEKKLMDYNGDGILNMTDVQLIQQKALNII